MGPTVGLFGFLARVNTVSAEKLMHAQCYLHVTAGHQGMQAARHICNIRPLKVNKVGNVCVTNIEACLDFFILMHALNSYCPKFLGLVHTKYSVILCVFSI